MGAQLFLVGGSNYSWKLSDGALKYSIDIRAN